MREARFGRLPDVVVWPSEFLSCTTSFMAVPFSSFFLIIFFFLGRDINICDCWLEKKCQMEADGIHFWLALLILILDVFLMTDIIPSHPRGQRLAA